MRRMLMNPQGIIFFSLLFFPCILDRQTYQDAFVILFGFIIIFFWFLRWFYGDAAWIHRQGKSPEILLFDETYVFHLNGILLVSDFMLEALYNLRQWYILCASNNYRSVIEDDTNTQQRSEEKEKNAYT